MRGRRDTTLILLGLATATDSTATGLYCAAAGRHVAFGDPDFPRVTPLRVPPEVLFGTSLIGLPVLSARPAAAIIVLALRFAPGR